MIIFFVAYVFFSGFRTYSMGVTHVALTVSVVIETKIYKASATDITDVIFIVVYISVIIGIHRLSAVIAVSVIVAVDAFKCIIADLACMTAIDTQVQALTYDVILEFLLGHYLISSIISCKFVSLKNLYRGRSYGLTVLELNDDGIYALNRIQVLIDYIEGYSISYSLIIDLKYCASVRKNLKLFGIVSFV